MTDVGTHLPPDRVAQLKEVAKGLAGWSSLLLPPFLAWHAYQHDVARIFSLRFLAVLVAGEAAFVLLAHLANMVLAALMAAVIAPIGLRSDAAWTRRVIRTVQAALLALFGGLLCVAAWFFAQEAVAYAF